METVSLCFGGKSATYLTLLCALLMMPVPILTCMMGWHQEGNQCLQPIGSCLGDKMPKNCELLDDNISWGFDSGWLGEFKLYLKD